MTLLKEAVAELAKDEDVKLWLDNLNSDSAKRLYGESLARYCQYLEVNPYQIVESFQKDQTQAEKKLQAFIQENRGRFAPKTVNNLLVGIKSWLRHNGIIVNRKINVGNTRLTPTLEAEASPIQDDVRRILAYADVRGRVAVALIGFAGLRPNTATSLRIANLPELSINGDSVAFRKIPTLIVVPPQHSKNTKGYMTFLIEEGCRYLGDYLKLRMTTGEMLTPESPLIRETGQGGHTSFSRKSFSKILKRIFEKAGVKARPYVLRAYFDTAIMNARSVPYDYQHFWMGHAGTIEATYTVNKRLPESQVEEMRRAFHEAVEPRLATVITEAASMEKFRALFKEDFLRTLNFTEEEIAKMNLSEMKMEDFQRLIRRALPGGGEIVAEKTLHNGGERFDSRQKVVSVDEVGRYLEDGWEFVSALNHEKAIVRLR